MTLSVLVWIALGFTSGWWVCYFVLYFPLKTLTRTSVGVMKDAVVLIASQEELIQEQKKELDKLLPIKSPIQMKKDGE